MSLSDAASALIFTAFLPTGCGGRCIKSSRVAISVSHSKEKDN